MNDQPVRQKSRSIKLYFGIQSNPILFLSVGVLRLVAKFAAPLGLQI